MTIIKTEQVMGLDGIVHRRHTQQLIRKKDGKQYRRLTCWYPRTKKSLVTIDDRQKMLKLKQKDIYKKIKNI
jgi:hypothetical protein